MKDIVNVEMSWRIIKKSTLPQKGTRGKTSSENSTSLRGLKQKCFIFFQLFIPSLINNSTAALKQQKRLCSSRH
jgi:hypothetical protein